MMDATAPAAAEPTRNRRRLRLVSIHVLTEINGARRSVEYMVGLVVLPVVLYAMFGLSNDSTWVDGTSPYSTISIGSFAAYGVVSLAIFTFVDELAKERARGWITTMAATPIPLWSHLAAKLTMAALYSLAIVALLAAVSVPTGASHLDPGSWLALAAFGIVGATVVGTVGIVVGFTVRPRAATAIANLVFLPLAFCSGFFFPLSEVPPFVRALAPWLPTYHLGRLMWSTTATQAEIDSVTGIDGHPLWVHGMWVAGLAVAGLVACRVVLRRTGGAER
jgi:ABC-2 type transport system permease protein